MMILAGVLGVFLILTIFDWPLAYLFAGDLEKRGEYDKEDWYSMLRIAGYLPTWLVVGAAFVLVDRKTERGSLIVGAAALAGLAAELLKLIVGRERPVSAGAWQDDALYHFRAPLNGFVDGSNLGFPSSHTAVAFGGACMVGLLLPRSRPLMVALATGCGITRMLTGAHFSTDVFAGALVGFGIAWWLARVAEIRPSDRVIWPPRWLG